MKKIIIISYFIITASFLYGQSDFSTIKIFRPKNFYGSGGDYKIEINGTYLCSIENGGYLEYKVHTAMNYRISAKYNLNNSYATSNVYVALGKTYYFNLTSSMSSGTNLAQISSAIDDKHLKESRKIAFADIEFENNRSIYNHPKTKWNKENLLEKWTKSPVSNIEGIYEKLGNSFLNEFAIIEENGQTIIIYLDGVSGTSWKPGELKGTIQKTASNNLFKAKLYSIDKSSNIEVVLSLKNNIIILLDPKNPSGEFQYVKTLPILDENKQNIIEKPNSEAKSFGTGFFINKSGLVATNFHVIENATQLKVSYLGQSFQAKVLKVDKINDLAVLKILDKNFEPLKDLDYSFESKSIDVGSYVFTLGYPLTQIMGDEIKFVDGKISSKSGFKGEISNYQISVPLQPGNSGGPLFDNNGNLIGITSSGINRNLNLTENVNYAIKSNYLKLLVDELDEIIELPKSKVNNGKNLTDQIKTLSKYVIQVTAN